MYRRLNGDQKKVASELFRYTALLAVLGISYQPVEESLWNVIVLSGLVVGFSIFSVDVLKQPRG